MLEFVPAEWLSGAPYGALFIVSLFAASILPFGSEWLFITLLDQGYSFWTVWWVASLGNTLGGWINYALAFW